MRTALALVVLLAACGGTSDPSTTDAAPTLCCSTGASVVACDPAHPFPCNRFHATTCETSTCELGYACGASWAGSVVACH